VSLGGFLEEAVSRAANSPVYVHRQHPQITSAARTFCGYRAIVFAIGSGTPLTLGACVESKSVSKPDGYFVTPARGVWRR